MKQNEKLVAQFLIQTHEIEEKVQEDTFTKSFDKDTDKDPNQNHQTSKKMKYIK